jgi:glyoxylase-like metal-dependent hydrolase (beta-lactamase superfamily II)
MTLAAEQTTALLEATSGQSTRPEPAWTVHALRYATVESTRGEQFLRFGSYGEPDGPLRLDYFLWAVTGEGTALVIDTGCTEAVCTRRGRRWLGRPVADLLEVAGVAAADVPAVIFTHLHYDHCGSTGLFPAATFLVDRRETEHWLGPMARREQFAALAEPEDLAALRSLRSSGRLADVGAAALPAGIRVEHVGGHTPGQVIVHVTTRGGPVVLTSDAVHLYEELERDRPYAIVSDVPAMYRGYDRVRALRDEGARIVAGHDPTVMGRFTPLLASGGEQVGVTVT